MRTPRAEEERMALGFSGPSNAFAWDVCSLNPTTELFLGFLRTNLQVLLS